MTLLRRRPFQSMRQVAVLSLVALCVFASGGRAAAAPHDVRAVTIVQMLRFVEWPPASGSGLTIAVVDNEQLGAALRQAYARIQPARRDVTVVDVPSASALSNVHASVVVLGAHSAPVARQLSRQGVVTVGNGECPDEPSLMLNLFEYGGRYRFSANPAAAARAGITLSSRLLRLAEITTE